MKIERSVRVEETVGDRRLRERGSWDGREGTRGNIRQNINYHSISVGRDVSVTKLQFIGRCFGFD